VGEKRKVKSYNANRRKRRPYQRRNIQHDAAAANNGNDDVDVFDMEFNRPHITSFPITNNNNNTNPPDLIDTSNDILSNYTSFLDSQRAKYTNLLENTPAHDDNAVVSSSTAAALPLPPAPPAHPAHPAAAAAVDVDDDDYDLKLSLFKNLKRNANIESLSLAAAAVQPNNKRFKLPFNLLQRDSMLEKSRKVNGPKFRRLKKNTSLNTINFTPRPHTHSHSQKKIEVLTQKIYLCLSLLLPLIRD